MKVIDPATLAETPVHARYCEGDHCCEPNDEVRVYPILVNVRAARRHPVPRLLGAREPPSPRARRRTGVSRALADEALGRGGALSRGCARGSSPGELGGGGLGAASSLAYDAMTDPSTRRRAERRVDRRAGIILFLLGSAIFALAISYLARIAGADLTALLGNGIR